LLRILDEIFTEIKIAVQLTYAKVTNQHARSKHIVSSAVLSPVSLLSAGLWMMVNELINLLARWSLTVTGILLL
jgi:hypothetical protein